jgi:hypothetical protein
MKFKKLAGILDTTPTIDLGGKRVKLNQKNYERMIADKELSDMFVNWYESNKEKVFIANASEAMKNMYEFKGELFWWFNVHDLLTECEYCGDFVNRSLTYCSSCNKDYNN